ncbi:MAG: hypothetical protein V8Q27_03745 [Eubacteriales bacterium]
MGNQLILAYDIGTSSVKTSLVTEIGEVYASAKCDYDTHHPEPGISTEPGGLVEMCLQNYKGFAGTEAGRGKTDSGYRCQRPYAGMCPGR